MKKLGFGLVIVLTACSGSSSSVDVDALHKRATGLFKVLPEKMPGSENDSPALVELGRKLFSDVRLSVNDTQSCDSCHMLDKGGVDGVMFSTGARGDKGGRNAPTVYNAGFHIAQFWDGRAEDLKAQAKGPILNPVEMGMPDEQTVVKKVSGIAEYRRLRAHACHPRPFRRFSKG